jgi:glyoxylase-like metal-dependent hydrolase (beta-lactamase superfamily II)
LLTPGGNIVPAFPNARYLVQRLEWDDALHNRSHMRVSYRTENLLPIQDAGALQLLEGDTEIVPGVRTVVTPGHTRAHQSVRIDAGGQTVFCFGDLCPTMHHLRGPYNMGYDLAPYETMTRKQPLIEQAAREGWIIVWDHDPDIAIGRIVEEDGRYRAVGLES